MRSCGTASCSGRQYTRLALACNCLHNCSPRHGRHDRRVTLLQCISATTDTTSLAKLSAVQALSADGPDSATCLNLPLQRRSFLAVATVTIGSLQWPDGIAYAEEPADSGAEAAPSSSLPASLPGAVLKPYINAKQQYQLQVPVSWDTKGKAGADVLFEDPARRSTSVGITVNPVKVASLAQFGGLEDVGDKLMQAERRKESTLDVVLVSSSSRQGASGATLYEYEYELDSTRGRKRILNTVTIFNSRLYILNAAFKCDKEGCGPAAEEGVRLLRQVAASFDVTAS